MQGKYMLIPVDQLGRLQAAAAYQSSGPSAQIENYTQKINAALNNKRLPDDIKLSEFGHQFNAFENFKQNELLRPVVRAPADVEVQDKGSPQVQKSPYVDVNKIVKGVEGKRNKQPAKRLLEFIVNHPDISVNDKNEVVLNNKRIVGSNIQELVSDLTRELSGSPALGAIEVARHLTETDMPMALIKNKYRKATLLASPPGEVFASPSSTPKRTPKKATKRNINYKSMYD